MERHKYKTRMVAPNTLAYCTDVFSVKNEAKRIIYRQANHGQNTERIQPCSQIQDEDGSAKHSSLSHRKGPSLARNDETMVEMVW